MLLPKSNTPRWIIMMLDMFMSLLSLGFAYLIRFDLKADKSLIQMEWEILSKSILIYFGVKFIVFYLFKIHKGLVRHTSTEDMRRIILASMVSSFAFLVLGMLRFYFYDGYFLFPMSVLMIEFLASTVLMLGGRFAIKLMYLESIKTKAVEEKVLIYEAIHPGSTTL